MSVDVLEDDQSGSEGEPDDEYIFAAKYEGDEETEVRILMMILGYPDSEIERVIANLRLDSGD